MRRLDITTTGASMSRSDDGREKLSGQESVNDGSRTLVKKGRRRE